MRREDNGSRSKPNVELDELKMERMGRTVPYSFNMGRSCDIIVS